ncbi:MAG: ribonuclease HII [Candidatus Lindowbacteria bacterium]|nr:ribonuclease HII [Candidatus Lindowbacteria bacterium]
MEIPDLDFKTMSLPEIEVCLAGLKPPFPERILTALKRDGRAGALKLCRGLISKQREANRIKARIDKLLIYEREARAQGHKIVAGVDEAGRGPIAGPVVAAAVILPPDAGFPEVNDSKLLTDAQRRKAFKIIAASAEIGIGVAGTEEIDHSNIYKANSLAMKLAIQDIGRVPDLVLVDGRPVAGLGVPQRAIVKGDRLSMSIAAASIVAKVVRDEMMLEFDKKYPQYKFAEHKGYATSEHLELIKKFGISPIHRRSFAPVTECVEHRLL